MSVQFNIWVTPSSQLQNTPQHGSSGQPIMQHVTKVVGSILERRTIIMGNKSISQKHNLMRENAVTIQNVTFNHHYILISHKSLKAQPLFILKDIQNEEDANCLFCTELLWINVVQSTLWTWVMHCAGPLKLRCLIGSRLSLLAGSSVNLQACVFKSKQMNHGTHNNSIYPLLPVSNNNRLVMTMRKRGKISEHPNLIVIFKRCNPLTLRKQKTWKTLIDCHPWHFPTTHGKFGSLHYNDTCPQEKP